MWCESKNWLRWFDHNGNDMIGFSTMMSDLVWILLYTQHKYLSQVNYLFLKIIPSLALELQNKLPQSLVFHVLVFRHRPFTSTFMCLHCITAMMHKESMTWSLKLFLFIFLFFFKSYWILSGIFKDNIQNSSTF